MSDVKARMEAGAVSVLHQDKALYNTPFDFDELAREPGYTE